MKEAPHQGTLLGEAERRLHGHDDDEGEEAEHVDEAAAQPGDVGLVEEGAHEVAEGQDAQAVVAEVEEEEEAVAFGQDAAVPQHQREDHDGDQQVGGALQEPGEEVAEWVDAHHFHVLQKESSTYFSTLLFISFKSRKQSEDLRCSWKRHLVQSQLSLVHQLLHKVSHKQHPGHHQHEREDKRDGLQVPGTRTGAGRQSKLQKDNPPDKRELMQLQTAQEIWKNKQRHQVVAFLIAAFLNLTPSPELAGRLQ